jgi:hypothetical protein
VYSLVSAPVLGFDLTRLDGGSAAGHVLLRALAFTADDLEVLADAAADDWNRIGLWQDVETAARARHERAALATASSASSDSSAVPPEVLDPTGALTLLERTPIGTVDGLLHCVRHDVLDWTWRRHPAGLVQLKSAARAASVLCDAAVAAYLRDMLPESTYRRLVAPWESVASHLPERRVDLGPQSAAVTAFIDRVRAMTPADLRRLIAASEVARTGSTDWSGAVHSASWAVFIAGRTRAAAAAQFLLVDAVDRAAIPVADRAGGCWNLLSGAVQALVVRDVLDSATLYRLLDPVIAAFGTTAPDQRRKA